MSPDEIYAQTVSAKGGPKKVNMGTSFNTTRYAQGAKAQPTEQTVRVAGKSNLEKAGEFSGNLLSSVGKAIVSTPKFVKDYAVDQYQNTQDFARAPARVFSGWYQANQDQVDSQRQSNEQRLDKVLKDYKEGKLTKDQYNLQMSDISKGWAEINKQVESNMNVLKEDRDKHLVGAKDTMILFLSYGSYAPSTVVARAGTPLSTSKSFLGAGLTQKLLSNKFGDAVVRLEELATKVPAIKTLLARNGAKFNNATTGFINQTMRDAAMGALIKQPFVYHSTIGDVSDIYRDLQKGQFNVGTAAKVAFTVTLAFDGGIFGAAGKALKFGKEGIATATLGRASMLDELSKRVGDKNPRAWVNWLDEAVDETDKAARTKYLRIMQEQGLRQFETGTDAADAYVMYFANNAGIDPSQLSIGQILDREVKYLQASETVDNLLKAGKIKDELGNALPAGSLAIGTFGREAREQLIANLEGKSFQEQMEYLDTIDDLWAQNEQTLNRVKKAVYDAGANGTDAGKAIKAIDTSADLSKYLPQDVAKQLGKDGYILIAPQRNLNKFVQVEDTRAIITDEIISGVDTLSSAKPVPGLNNFHGLLKKAGLSTEAANDVAYKQLYTTVASNLGELPVAKQFADFNAINGYDASKTGKTILGALQEYAEKKAPNAVLSLGGRTSSVNAITDIRQLSTTEIMEALQKAGYSNITRAQAKQVSGAILDGYKALPLELRGLGDRFVDNMFKYVPGFREYNRVQSALRYTYNPFFRVQEISETKILSKATSGNLIWRKSRAQLDEVVAKLDDARIFNTGFSGQGARDDVVLGRITANLTQYQKRDLAGLATKLAEKRGVDIDTMLRDHIDEVEDALKVIVQYPSKGLVSSPLARTMNLVFFPMRYNIKVASIAAKIIAKQPPVVQYAFLNSMMDATNWLKTDEGLLWQSENSEALGILRWVTPYGSVESVVNMLNGSTDAITDLGVLGGLPAGVLFQMLDSQGAFQDIPGPLQYSTPYVNPKTGEVYPDKIPANVKSRAAVALADFINSTFTYPGRVLGLPGKGEAIRTGVGALVSTRSKDYTYVDQTNKLTELQKRQSELLKEKALDDMTDDELLSIYTTDGQWSIPNLGMVVTPNVKPPKAKPQMGRTGTQESSGQTPVVAPTPLERKF